MGEFVRRYGLYLLAAAALHGALAAFLVVNLETSVPVLPSDEVPDAIDAVVIDEQAVQQQLERLRADEQRRLDEIDAGRRAAEQAAQQRAAEERRLRELQAQRERDTQAAQQAQREATERQRQEQARIEQLARQRAEAQRAADEARREREAEEARRAQREREERERLAREAEQREQAARRQQLLGEYAAAIRGAVERSWIRPADWPAGTECTVRVSQIPGGEVVEARVTRSCGSPTLDRSVEDAVLRASPLPRPPDPAVFSRELEFVFRPEI